VFSTTGTVPVAFQDQNGCENAKAIHAQESKSAAREKAAQVAKTLRDMKLKEAAAKIEESIEETLAYADFPGEHWTRIRTNNVIERLNREIRRRTRVVGAFPDGKSALMLVCAPPSPRCWNPVGQ
jgi:transposase-like protein